MNSKTSKKHMLHSKVNMAMKNHRSESICSLKTQHKEPLTDFEHVKTALTHFDHIQDESEHDRNLVFSNILKAADYFGINAEKLDFHKQD